MAALTSSEATATVRAETPEATRSLGRKVAGLLRAGDVVVLIGHLGAGKTTFAQGIGDGLGVRGPVSSPTFVISRVHPSLRSGPPLVHVDAYRLGGAAELDDLDLDTTLDSAVTIVEWGEGLAEVLTESRLEVRLSVDDRDAGAGVDAMPGECGAAERPPSRCKSFSTPGSADQPEVADRLARIIHLTGFGPRWAGGQAVLAPIAAP